MEASRFWMLPELRLLNHWLSTRAIIARRSLRFENCVVSVAVFKRYLVQPLRLSGNAEDLLRTGRCTAVRCPIVYTSPLPTRENSLVFQYR